MWLIGNGERLKGDCYSQLGTVPAPAASESLTLTGAGPDAAIIQAASQLGVANTSVFLISSILNAVVSGLTIRHSNL